MVKNLLAGLALALALGFVVSLGTGNRNAEAASNPTITTDAPVSPDTCTSTQTGYGNYGGYGGYGGYTIPGYGVPGYGVPGYNGGIYGGIYGPTYDPWNYPPQYSSISPNYGQTYTTYSCNMTQCQPIPYYTTVVVCPGPSAGITMPTSPTTTSCASAVDINVTVADANGLKVADGIEVDFTTTFGMITAVAYTQNGIATASLNTPTKQTGTATIVAKSGSATSTPMTITVGCNAPGSTAGGSTAPVPQQTYAAPVMPSGSSYGYGY